MDLSELVRKWTQETRQQFELGSPIQLSIILTVQPYAYLKLMWIFQKRVHSTIIYRNSEKKMKLQRK